MKKREDRRVTMTKLMLKSALIGMLRKRDIYHVSIRELCEEADVNRTTFYKHYGNQFELLDEMERDLLRAIENTIKEDQVGGTDMIERILFFLEKNIDFVRLLLNSNVDPEFPQKLFSLAIVTGSIDGAMVGVPREEQVYVNRFVLFGVYEMVRAWVNKENREAPHRMAEIIHKRLNLNFDQKKR